MASIQIYSSFFLKKYFYAQKSQNTDTCICFFRKMSSTMDELAKKLGAEFANLINV
jgi:hypothetical protein